jgi:hypothetical protein
MIISRIAELDDMSKYMIGLGWNCDLDGFKAHVLIEYARSEDKDHTIFAKKKTKVGQDLFLTYCPDYSYDYWGIHGCLSDGAQFELLNIMISDKLLESAEILIDQIPCGRITNYLCPYCGSLARWGHMLNNSSRILHEVNQSVLTHCYDECKDSIIAFKIINLIYNGFPNLYEKDKEFANTLGRLGMNKGFSITRASNVHDKYLSLLQKLYLDDL